MERRNERSLLVGGFYREWTRENESSSKEHMETLVIFTKQMEAAAGEKKTMLITGDANLCFVKWHEAGFRYQALATEYILCTDLSELNY